MDKKSFDIDDKLLLIHAVCQKDKEALLVLYLKYSPYVKSYIASHVSSVADTEDLVQEVFLQVCLGRGHYDSSKGAKSYILGIARNMIREHLRRTKRFPRTMPADLMNGLSINRHIRERLDHGARIGVDRFKRIMRTMETSLTPKAREAIHLRFIEGLSMKEATQKAGCSISAFYKRSERAKNLLRDALKAGS